VINSGERYEEHTGGTSSPLSVQPPCRRRAQSNSELVEIKPKPDI
jgi:hypothetical protein